MATFGSISSANPNVLFDPAAAIGAAQQQQRNQLLMENAAQDQAFQAEERQRVAFERDREDAGKLAGSVLQLPEAERAAAYEAGIREYQQHGRMQRSPARFDQIGTAGLQKAYSMLLTPTQLEARSDRLADRTALGARYPVPGAAPASVPSVPGAAPAAPSAVRPFVASNLPQGVDPETDIIVRTVIGEAGGEDDRGQQAVAGVIGNRVKQSGMDTAGVIFAPNQFEPWNNPQTRAKLEQINPASPEYQRALANVQRVRSGQVPDPTNGATHFYSPTAQAALGRPAPSWDNGGGVDLGRHRFFSLGYAPGSGAPGAPAAPQQAAAPAPQPTPPGGVAARTGGTDTAGPGVPAAPDIGPSGFTPQQERALAERARSRGTTQAQMDALEHTFRTENAAALRHQEAMAQRKAEHPPADPTAAFGGNGIDAQANNILLRVGPKIANGTATDAERQQYELAHGHMTRGTTQLVDDGKGGQVLARIPGLVPPSFPAPDFRPPAPGAAPSAAGAAPSAAAAEPGAAVPVPGTTRAPVMTESQGKAAGFADRITAALPIIEENAAAGAGLTDRALSRVPAVGGFLTSSAFQKADQAQRDFINAVLRRESGAVISDAEFENARQQYFPQPGNPPEVLKQKKENRERVLNGIRREAGPAYQQPGAAGAGGGGGNVPAPPPGFTVVQ